MREQELDRDRLRTYRSSVKSGQGSVKGPRGWGVDRESVKWSGAAPEAWSLMHDQDGIVRLRTNGSESGAYAIDIAPSTDAIDLAPPEGDVPVVTESFPDELALFARDLFGSGLSFGAKVRRLASKIHGHLKPALKKHGWKMRRFVIATADAGSDDASAVKRANAALKADGIPVDLFLLSPEGDENLKEAAQRAYQSVTPVSDVRELASKGLAKLTSRISEAYKQTV